MKHSRAALHHLAAYGTPPSEEVACQLTVGLDGFVQRWVNETLRFLEAGGSELRFVEAEYGRGKTHLLHVLAQQAREAGFAVACVQCSPEFKPFASPADTYRTVFRNLKFLYEDRLLDLPSLIGALEHSTIRELSKSKGVNLGFAHLVRAYSTTLRSPVPNSGLIRDLSALLRADPAAAIRLSDVYAMDSRLPKPIGKLGKRTATPWLHSLVRLPKTLGYKGTILLFDETGADFHAARESATVRRMHLAQLRNLVDHLGVGDLPGTGIIYAAAADLVAIANESLPPLAQRIERTNPNATNHRAIWCYLDELTVPKPDQEDFFVALGGRLMRLALAAGIEPEQVNRAHTGVHECAQNAARSIRRGSVRAFMKEASTHLISP